MKTLVGGVETPYQVVAITRQLLNRRVLPKAISYVSRYLDEVAVLVAPSVEVAAPGAARNVIDNWIIPQPEAARLSRRSFVEAGLADLNGPEIEGYGKLLGHGWLLKEFTPEAISATPLGPAMSVCKSILDAGFILLGCRVDSFTAGSVPAIFRERNAQLISEVDV
ncbi:MAG: hypothetical protein KGJ86_18070 [Chloroflexota bacterium]|nr:hypothetical protein [Chloroflexota bacterium]